MQFPTIFKSNQNKKMKVEQLASNQFIIHLDNGDKVFQSYDTKVCTISNLSSGNHPSVKITEGQPQSKITAKYLNRFLQMFTQFDNYKKIIQ